MNSTQISLVFLRDEERNSFIQTLKSSKIAEKFTFHTVKEEIRFIVFRNRTKVIVFHIFVILHPRENYHQEIIQTLMGTDILCICINVGYQFRSISSEKQDVFTQLLFLGKTYTNRKLCVLGNSQNSISSKKNKNPFLDFKSKLESAYKVSAYTDSSVTIIPISLKNSEGITKNVKKVPYYQNSNFLDYCVETVIDNKSSSNFVLIKEKLEYSSQNYYLGQVFGEFENTSGLNYLFPSKQSIHVDEIFVNFKPGSQLHQNDMVLIPVKYFNTDLTLGAVIYNSDSPVDILIHEKDELILQMVRFQKEIRKESILTLFLGGNRITCKVKELQKKFDPKTGQVIKENPTSIGKAEVGILKVELLQRTIGDIFKSTRKLGSFSEFHGAQILAAGVVLKINKFAKNTVSDGELLIKFKKIVKMVQNVELDVIAGSLKLSKPDLFEKLIDWQDNIPFKLNGNLLVVDNLDGFANAIDDLFQDWKQNEDTKYYKL